MRAGPLKSDKGAEDVVQKLEHLLCKHKAMSSNPSSTKKEKKKSDEAVALSLPEWVIT
jgi:hypothetical protein